MTSNLPPDGPVTAQDIRNVGFTRVKKGYDTEEVNSLLEQVSATLDALARAEGARRAAAASEPSNDASPAPLHDPEGAAQRLLAAAQRTADGMTADADEYAERVRREADDYVRSERSDADDYASRVRPEADDYAQSARAEADAHAEAVTSAAERQAATLLSAAAEEARHAAEEARGALVEDMATLQSGRDALQGDIDQLSAYVKSERDRLLASLEDIRSVVASGEFDSHEDLEISSVEASDLVIGDGDVSVDDTPVDDTPIDSEVDDVADESASNTADLTLDIDLGEPDAAVFDLTSAADGLEEADEVSAGVSVFDIQSEFDEDLNADPKWLEDLSSDDAGEEPETGIDDVTIAAASIFDIEAVGSAEPIDEPDLGGPPTQSLQLDIDDRGEGDRFFDELQQVDAEEDTLGPLDEDTDAALSAFFEPEGDEDVESRWRDRFGPRS
jgi:DivIVA domain-containing protein